jgi:hypothetical protein
MVASPIRMIQRNGRTGRKRDGKVIILITEGKEEEKLFQSMDRMDVMQNSTQRVKLMSQLHFSQKLNGMISKDCVMVERDLSANRGTESPRPDPGSIVPERVRRVRSGPNGQGMKKSIPAPTQHQRASVKQTEVIALDDEQDSDLFSWSSYPTPTSSSELVEPQVTNEPTLLTIDLSHSPTKCCQKVGSRFQKCSLCGGEFPLMNNSLTPSSMLCPVCVEMMISVPLSQDNDTALASLPLAVSLVSPTCVKPSLPPPRSSMRSPLTVTFQISPSTSDPKPQLPQTSANPPSASVESLYQTLERVLTSSRLDFDLEHHCPPDPPSQLQVKADHQLITDHLDARFLFQKPSNSSARYQPILRKLQPTSCLCTSTSVIQSASEKESQLSLMTPHPTLREKQNPSPVVRYLSPEIGQKQRGLANRFCPEIPAFPSLTSQDSDQPTPPILSPLRMNSSLHTPRMDTALPIPSPSTSSRKPIDNLHILLPDGKKFRLSSSIFSDDEDDEGQGGISPPHHCDLRQARPQPPNQSQRVRERSERRSKKLEDRRIHESRSAPAEPENNISWDWSWPLVTPPMNDSDQQSTGERAEGLAMMASLETPTPPLNVSPVEQRAALGLRIDSSRSPGSRCSDDDDDAEEDVTVISLTQSESDCRTEICQICTSRGRVWSQVTCDDEVVEELLVSCSDCKLFTHLSCYGLEPQHFSSSSSFSCDSCKYLNEVGRSRPRPPLVCHLCSQETGMMRRGGREREKGQWVHPLCVLYTPELTLDADHSMLPTDLSCLDRDRDLLLCVVCGKEGGSNIQCSYESCLVSYHPYCGFMSDKLMVIRCVEGEEEDYRYHYEVYCDQHRMRVPQRDSIVSTTAPLPLPPSSSAPVERQRKKNSLASESLQSPPPRAHSSSLGERRRSSPYYEDDSWVQESHEKRSMKRRRSVALHLSSGHSLPQIASLVFPTAQDEASQDSSILDSEPSSPPQSRDRRQRRQGEVSRPC